MFMYSYCGVFVVVVTVPVPVELKQDMKSFPEINWSEVARQAFAQKVRDLRFLKQFASESTLTEEDAIRLGREVNASLAKRFSPEGSPKKK